MRTFRQASPMKLVLAATVLVNAFGTTPTIGHAHGRPHPLHDDHHLTWADHDHSAEHAMPAESDQHPDPPIIGGAVFHLHGVWFGIPFGLTSPTSPGTNRNDPHPEADVLPMSGVTAVAKSPGTGLQPMVWP